MKQLNSLLRKQQFRISKIISPYRKELRNQYMSFMCELHTLYCCNKGYVVRCRCCGYIQVAFGTSLINFSPEDFERLLEMMQVVCSGEAIRLAEDCKNIAVPTPYSDVNIILSGKEAFQLLAIIEKADTEMKTQQLMQLFD